MKKWLKSILTSALALVMFSGCSILPFGSSEQSSSSVEQEDDMCTVSFELCTDLKTNYIEAQEVEKGDIVTKPSVSIVGENTDRMEVEAWYTDAEYTTKWNFLIDTVEEDMTLYAKWIKKFAVNYYLGDAVDEPMYTQYLKEGEIIEPREDLADGYESKGFFANAAQTKEFEFGNPITQDVNVYINRSEYFYFDGEMIANRFKMCEAPSGPGSTAGTLEAVEEENGDVYAKMNFGYSTGADPHALLENVTVDISKSQKIEITMKNVGPSASMRLYFLTWLPDGSYVDAPYFNERSAVSYRFSEDEKNMTEEDEWLTITLDMAKDSVNDGVSFWGISTTLTRLRFQSSYVSADENDLSNEFWIKSIKGIADETYTKTDDSENITEMRKDDDAVEVQQVADAQEDVAGWVFPKDFENVSVSGAEIYNKKDGLLFYSFYRTEDNSISFVPSEDEVINLDELTTIKIRLKNFGYASKIKIEYTNISGITV